MPLSYAKLQNFADIQRTPLKIRVFSHAKR